MLDFTQQMITQWISSWVGMATQSHFPGSRLMAKEFTRFYRINLAEAKEEPTYYSNIHRIFTRQLNPNLRTIHNDPNSFVSPCDGEVSEFGQISLHHQLKIKKTHDCVETLLGSRDIAKPFEGGDYVIIHLRPKDYHRVHAPYSGNIIYTQHIPGSLFPVNCTGQRWFKNLYQRNERLVILIETKLGKVALVFVGAFLVGSIQFHFPIHHDLKLNHPFVEKGDEIGYFQFGSTIILMTEKDRLKLFPLKLGQELRLGEPISSAIQ